MNREFKGKYFEDIKAIREKTTTQPNKIALQIYLFVFSGLHHSDKCIRLKGDYFE